METEILYKIANYSELYKPTDSKGRELVNASWVKLPVKPKGNGLESLLEQKDGLKIFAVWCLLLEATTANKKGSRGDLLNHKDEPASILDIAKSISLKKEVGLVKQALNALVALGWVLADSVRTESVPDADDVPPKSSVVKSSVVKSNKEEKTKHLDFVLLTDDEYKKLVAKFGEAGTKDRIENLNEGIGSKGYKYDSHYFTILSWARKNECKDGKKQKPVRLSDEEALRFAQSG